MVHPKVDVSRLGYHRNERATVLPSERAHLWIYLHKQSCERSATKISRKDKLTHPIPKNAFAFESSVSILGVAREHRPSALSSQWQDIGVFLPTLKVLRINAEFDVGG